MKKNIYILFLLLIALFVADVLMGGRGIAVGDIFKSLQLPTDNMIKDVILNYRIPKALLAICVGVSLSITGVLMQTLFRNPLAGPDLLGINSGAGLGVAIVTLISSTGGGYLFSNLGIISGALLGSFITMIGVLAFSMYIRNNVSLLIAGIMFGYLASALISIIQSISNPDAVRIFVVWGFGSLSGAGWSELKILIPIVIIGYLCAILLSNKLNTLLLGENYARGLGVNVKGMRVMVVTLTAVIVAFITVYAGPIGFIGMTVPHIGRWILGSGEHRKLLPLTAIIGGAIMLLCDIVSNIPYTKLPINAVTALIGTPLVVYIILKDRYVN